MSKTKSLIKQLYESAKNLSLENKKVFEDTVVYMRTSHVKTRDTEEFLQQILDSFLNAEQQGVSIETMLGTADIKHYCEEIVTTYKSSYNYLSFLSEYIMYTGMLIVILSFINYITQSISIFIMHGADNLTMDLTFDLTFISQSIFIVFAIIAVMTYTRKSCFKNNNSFKEPSRFNKVKNFIILYILCMLFMCIMVAFSMFLSELILFRLNIIIVLLIGSALYFIGKYLMEK
ncbi:MAG TPA: hypothetical protein VIK78_08875 [Ruminiclostridium sp.]